jgi:hypothetical protein
MRREVILRRERRIRELARLVEAAPEDDVGGAA